MNVTYYLGAGASAEALPVVNGIPERIKEQKEMLEGWLDRIPEILEHFNENTQESARKTIPDYIKGLDWLYNESSRHASIDTYAKKLYISNKFDDLHKLKIIFSIFLIIEQLRRPVDMRYDSFLASILKGPSLSFPGNIKILSWNYDFQIEKACVEYSPAPDDFLFVRQYHVDVMEKVSHVTYMPTYDPLMVKMNGTAITYNKDENKKSFDCMRINFDDSNLEANICNMIDSYYPLSLKSDNSFYSCLSFAWENNPLNDEYVIIKKSREIMKKTDVLVIIGYSFPYFNREIDKQILSDLPNLKKVYVQDPYDAEAVKERLMATTGISGEKIVCVNDGKMFYLPNEL